VKNWLLPTTRSTVTFVVSTADATRRSYNVYFPPFRRVSLLKQHVAFKTVRSPPARNQYIYVYIYVYKYNIFPTTTPFGLRNQRLVTVPSISPFSKRINTYYVTHDCRWRRPARCRVHITTNNNYSIKRLQASWKVSCFYFSKTLRRFSGASNPKRELASVRKIKTPTTIIKRDRYNVRADDEIRVSRFAYVFSTVDFH